MANYEWTNNVGEWFFHSEHTSAKFDRMTINEEANHQNKPRTCHQYESTYEILGEGDGEFVEISHLQPDHTAMLFGVQVIDSDDFAVDVSSSNLLFPTGPGIGPFTRAPVVEFSGSAFAISDADTGFQWENADLTSPVDATAADEWLLVALGQPFAAASLDNYKAGLAFLQRIAGFDASSPNTPGAGLNYYIFWHATGPVAAYF